MQIPKGQKATVNVHKTKKKTKNKKTQSFEKTPSTKYWMPVLF
jgi:hypothetical protein